MIVWKRPFSVLNLDARTFIIDAEMKRLTEITPGQFAGYVPTRADQHGIADLIVGALNELPFLPSDRWTDCSEQSPTATREAAG